LILLFLGPDEITIDNLNVLIDKNVSLHMSVDEHRPLVCC